MKTFISWSGNLSKNIAEIINKWVPCIVDIKPFISSNDIQKGEKWNEKISNELLESNYGIVCLTKDNMNSSWINFEAGAIAKTMNSRVYVLLIDINPSEVTGPLLQFQTACLEKDDLLKVVLDINKNTKQPKEESIITRIFEPIWKDMQKEINQEIEKSSANKSKKETVKTITPLDEIIMITRNQAQRQEQIIEKMESFMHASVEGFGSSQNMYGFFKNLLFLIEKWIIEEYTRFNPHFVDELLYCISSSIENVNSRQRYQLNEQLEYLRRKCFGMNNSEINMEKKMIPIKKKFKSDIE